MHERIKDGFLKVRARPGSPKTLLVGWDDSISAYRIDVHARAEDNKANAEILKLLMKLTGRRALIRSGSRSRDKLIKFIS